MKLTLTKNNNDLYTITSTKSSEKNIDIKEIQFVAEDNETLIKQLNYAFNSIFKDKSE